MLSKKTIEKNKMKRIDAILEYEQTIKNLAAENFSAYDIYAEYINLFDCISVECEEFITLDEYDEFVRAYVHAYVTNQPTNEEVKEFKDEKLKSTLYIEFIAQINRIKEEFFYDLMDYLEDDDYNKIIDIYDLIDKGYILNDVKDYLMRNNKNYNELCTESKNILELVD